MLPGSWPRRNGIVSKPQTDETTAWRPLRPGIRESVSRESVSTRLFARIRADTVFTAVESASGAEGHDGGHDLALAAEEAEAAQHDRVAVGGVKPETPGARRRRRDRHHLVDRFEGRLTD